MTLLDPLPCSESGHGEQTYCGHEFATLGAATEAAEQTAWDIIQIKFPNVQRSEVDWYVVTEALNGYVRA